MLFLTGFSWIFEHFLASKVHFYNDVTKNSEDMLNFNLKTLIWWKQNQNCIFRSKVMSIFVKQSYLLKKVVVSKAMGIFFKSPYVVQLACQVSSLSTKLILEGVRGQYNFSPGKKEVCQRLGKIRLIDWRRDILLMPKSHSRRGLWNSSSEKICKIRKKRLQYSCFPLNFLKFFDSFFTGHLRATSSVVF